MKHIGLRHRIRNIPFFWRLVAAFTLIAVLGGGGLLFVAFFVMWPFRSAFVDYRTDVVDLCVTRLGEYYAVNSDWEGVDRLFAEGPCSRAVRLVQRVPNGDFALIRADGQVMVTSDSRLTGRELPRIQWDSGIPVIRGNVEVGRLFIPPSEDFSISVVTSESRSSRRFLMGVAAIGILTFLATVVISRRMARPLTHLIRASHAVALGDLSARVPAHYTGEIGELAAAFNRMTAALSRADELRRNMTADVAHELRTPLSVIRGKLEGILDGVYPSTPEHLEPILDETRLLTRLVDDLHLLALAEAGQLTLEKRALDVADVLRDSHVNFGPQAGDRGITLALHLPAPLPKVMADWRRVAQIVGNLVTNALRHTPSGGVVTLSATLEGSFVSVAVSDTGSGISSEDMPYIFERFWRGEKSRSRAGGGSGLGLSIAKKLVELHGGTVSATSAVGEGTRICFTLPLAG
ncbi:MAG: HAMP domain-containing protein [Anaerolineae bacterium]|nr:HAMP domain-containing protein [Anaerolineae bacterium]